MAQENFTKALSLCGEDNFNMLTIGGGEPTLHKNCMDYVWQAVRHMLSASEGQGMSSVGIVTNGSVEKRALELAQMAKMGLISARLSYDRFHDLDMVSERVHQAFKVPQDMYGERKGNENDARVINQMDYFIMPHGRALDNEIYNHPYQKKDSCCCDGVFITPDGKVWQCGCRQKQIGDLSDIKALWRTMADIERNEDYEIPCSKKSI
jgi:hypothetical protein